MRWALVLIGLPVVLTAAVFKHGAEPQDRPADPGRPVFTAKGNEPFWSVEVGAGTITFKTAEGATVTANAVRESPIEGGRRHSGRSDGRDVSVTIFDRRCVDSMSGLPFANTVLVKIEDHEFRGCGGNVPNPR